MPEVLDRFRSSTWGWLRGTLVGWLTLLLGVQGGGFQARGVAIGRDSAALGLGVSSALNASTDLRLDYDASLNADRAAQAVSLALHVTW